MGGKTQRRLGGDEAGLILLLAGMARPRDLASDYIPHLSPRFNSKAADPALGRTMATITPHFTLQTSTNTDTVS